MNYRRVAIRDISDTARLAAVYRALEGERSHPLFVDPFARRLAGVRGYRVASTFPFTARSMWSWSMRTYLIDQFIARQIQQGVDMIINLAAGLDARPYRLALPSSLRWIEIDLPSVIEYKEQVLSNECPTCILRRFGMDLRNRRTRCNLFEQLDRAATRALVITEGLIVYLTADQAGSLAHDLACPPSFQRWVVDLLSPALLRVLRQSIGAELRHAGARLKFAPAKGPNFFRPYGWKAVAARSVHKTAARLNRLPSVVRLLVRASESGIGRNSGPWSTVCLLGKL